MTNQNPWQNLRVAIEATWPVSRYRDVGVVVGCSGGADSVALVRCLVESIRAAGEKTTPSGFMVIAHFNHQFRGDHSRADAEFVSQLAQQLSVPLEIACGNSSRQDEDSARNQRRSFFRDVVRRRGARYLALGHSLDDNVETVLYRLMRGTGPAGMAGILPFRPLADDPLGSDFVVARPMLALGRKLIRDALRGRGFQWREDQSNGSNQYQRNWIRNELLPAMQSQFPEAVPAIGRAIDGQRQWFEVMQPNIDRWLDRFRIQSNPLILRRLDRIATVDPTTRCDKSIFSPAIAIEALRACWHRSGWPLRDMGHFHWGRVVEMLSGAGPDVLTLPGSIDVRRDDQFVTFLYLPRCSQDGRRPGNHGV